MGWGRVMCNGYRFPVREDEKVLEMDMVTVPNNGNCLVLNKTD